MTFRDPTVFVEETPKTAAQLAQLQEDYRKAFGQELPNSVELAMRAEKAPEKAS